MEIKEFDSYQEIEKDWALLNRSYRSGELVFDYKAHTILWDHFYHPRDVALKIVAGFDRGECVGIFPFILYDDVHEGVRCWTYTEDFLIGREYFCKPFALASFFTRFPIHKTDDMTCFPDPEIEKVMKENERYFFKEPAGIIRIGDSWDEYFRTLSQKGRYLLRRTLHDNQDIRVEQDHVVRKEEIRGILSKYLDYWARKKKVEKEDPVFLYCRDKIHTDLLLMERASEMNKLIAVYGYLGERLLAANFSVRRGNTCVDDYICVRDTDEEYASRGMGIFVILKNMEICRDLGIQYYNLSSQITDYKRKFLNSDFQVYNFSNLFLLKGAVQGTGQA